MMERSIFLVAALAVSPACAHDRWADGSPVPPWVQDACCGPSDAHHLRPDEVQRRENCWGENSGSCYHIAGYPWPVSTARALPSQDSEYWAFYRDDARGGDPGAVVCFFAPMNF